MLIKCPECELQISDKAAFCPHCGYVMNKRKVKIPRQKKNKRKRLPNGFGQISKINNARLRNPYRAMVTVGKDSNGKCIQKPLKPKTYFKTYNDAYEALVEYNKNPYNMNTSTMTLNELYEMWFEEHEKTLNAESSKAIIRTAWKYCEDSYNTLVADVRPRHNLRRFGELHLPMTRKDYAISYQAVPDRNIHIYKSSVLSLRNQVYPVVLQDSTSKYLKYPVLFWACQSLQILLLWKGMQVSRSQHIL